MSVEVLACEVDLFEAKPMVKGGCFLGRRRSWRALVGKALVVPAFNVLVVLAAKVKGRLAGRLSWGLMHI